MGCVGLGMSQVSGMERFISLSFYQPFLQQQEEVKQHANKFLPGHNRA